MADCEVRRSGESDHTPTECENLWLIINHKEYIQSLQENILVNLMDVDFIYTKVIHACDNLHNKLSECNYALAHEWCSTLKQHVHTSHEYLKALKHPHSVNTNQLLNDWHQVHQAAKAFLQDDHLWNTHYNCLIQCFMHRCMGDPHVDQEFWQLNSGVSKQIAELMWCRFSK